MRSSAEGLAVLELRDVGLTAMFWGQKLAYLYFGVIFFNGTSGRRRKAWSLKRKSRSAQLRGMTSSRPVNLRHGVGLHGT